MILCPEAIPILHRLLIKCGAIEYNFCALKPALSPCFLHALLLDCTSQAGSLQCFMHFAELARAHALYRICAEPHKSQGSRAAAKLLNAGTTANHIQLISYCVTIHLLCVSAGTGSRQARQRGICQQPATRLCPQCGPCLRSGAWEPQLWHGGWPGAQPKASLNPGSCPIRWLARRLSRPWVQLLAAQGQQP